MALEQPLQLYKESLSDPLNGLYVLVSCAPAVRTNKTLRGMSGTSEPSRPSSARPLHFVNTDADSIGAKGAGRRTRDVKSHLSGHYRRWKKQQALTTQSITTQQQQQQQQQQQHTTQGVTAIASGPSNSVEPTRWERDLIPILLNDSPSSDEAPSPGELAHRIGLKPSDAVAMHLRNLLSHGNSDPFGVLPLPVDAKTNMHIQLFYEGTTVMCWKRTIDSRLRDLLHSEALMHGVLAISKMIAARYLPGPQNTAILLPESRQHYGDLLRLMRSHFESHEKLESDLAIEMMHAAATFTFLAQEYDEFEFHMKSLNSLIGNMGGLKAIDQCHSSRFLNAERLRGLFLLKKSLTNVNEWAPGAWVEVDKFRPFDRLYARGRHLMSVSNLPHLPEGPFSKRASNIIMDHRDMLAAGSAAATVFVSNEPGLDLITNWMGFRSHALTIRTTETVIDIMTVSQSQPSLELSLHACACLAANFTSHLIHFSINPTVGLAYVPFPLLSRHLRDVAHYLQHGARLQHEALFLWALFVGACTELASRTWSCDPKARGSTWCSTNLVYMIEKLGILTVEDLREKLRQYLFPFMFESYLRVLFEKRHELINLTTEN